MSFLCFAVNQPKVMAVCVHRDAVAAALQPLGAQITPWEPPDAGLGFGEALVMAAMRGSDEVRPDLLLCPSPTDADPARRALAAACLEAARRNSVAECAWPKADCASGGVAAGPEDWEVVQAEALFDKVLALGIDGLKRSDLQPARARPAADVPLVSVIVRSMDRASLNRALASVALQTYRPIELVLVNAKGIGHSPWPAVEADLQIKTVASEQGQPLARSRAANAGLDAATGKWALFLDDDDVLLPDHLSRLVKAARAQGDGVAAYTDVELGEYAGGVWKAAHGFSAPFDPVRLLFENYLPIHGVLFRRSLTPQQVRFDTAFDLFEDWDFWLQLAALAPFAHVSGISARYVREGVGQSEVFSESPAAQAARRQLYDKWRDRISPDLHVAAMFRLQSLYREAAQARPELALLRAGQADLQAMLVARDHEIADALRHHSGLQSQLEARDLELAHALAEVRALREVVAHREREVSEGQAHAASLLEILSHRDREISDALTQLADLREAVAARDGEVAAQAQAIATRDTTIAAHVQAHALLQSDLAQIRQALEALQSEGPLQGLTRTLKNKFHASRS